MATPPCSLARGLGSVGRFEVARGPRLEVERTDEVVVGPRENVEDVLDGAEDFGDLMEDEPEDDDHRHDGETLGENPVDPDVGDHEFVVQPEDEHGGVGEEVHVLVAEGDADEDVPDDVEAVDDGKRDGERAGLPPGRGPDGGDETDDDGHAPDASAGEDDGVGNGPAAVLEEDEGVLEGELLALNFPADADLGEVGHDGRVVADEGHRPRGVGDDDEDEPLAERGEHHKRSVDQTHDGNRASEGEQRLPSLVERLGDQQ